MRLPSSLTPSRRGRGLSGLVGAGALACLLMAGGGCDVPSFIDPSELGGQRGRPNRMLPIQILDRIDPAVEEPSTEYANAQPARPEDLRAPVGDYAISRNDILTVSISDLQGPGVETTKQSRVSESGNISLPYIGQIRAEGLTEIELEREIVEAYRRANLIQSATVSVVVFEARGRAFTITGAVTRPGVYAIVESDYRVTDALAAAGDTNSPLTKELYILRRLDERPRPAEDPNAAPGQPGQGGPGQPPAGQGGDLAPRSDRGAGAGADDAQAAADAAPRQAGNRRERILHLMQARPAQDSGADDRIINLDGQEVPARRGQAPTTRPSGAGTGTTGRTTGRTTGASGQTTGRMTAQGPAGRGGQGGQGGTFAFNDLGPPPDVRVIRVSLDDLRRGDLSQNVVIRPRDTIFVPTPEFGTYYMGGHVARPGAYTLSGQRVTLKQAIIAASMLDQLAIPQRTDVIRRLGPDREVWVRVDLAKVFAGRQPDIYIKPDDQVLVGTNALAPFLASLRNSFRFTYGAGFIYDRNFAYDDFYQDNDDGGGGPPPAPTTP